MPLAHPPCLHLSQRQFDALLQDARSVETDGNGLKVAQLANGDFLKLYRRKRFFSRALWSPPARRFAEHAVRLRALGLVTPEVLAWLRVAGQTLTVVRYRPLPGETLRQRWPRVAVCTTSAACTTSPEHAATIAQEVAQFGALLGRLHQLGVYFRSVHLGNVLRLPDGELGLIDLADLRIGRGALCIAKRQRNLRHILRYPEDAAWLVEKYASAWRQGYAQTGGGWVLPV